MAFTLVGTAGTVSTGTAGATVTPAYGSGANRTANNLLVLQVMSTGSATLPAAISGWSIAKQQAGTSCSASIYYKVAAGSDAAPVVPVVAGAIHNARLLEFSGGLNATPLDQTAGVAGTATPIVATAAAADALAEELVIASAGTIQSSARANASMAHTVNNGVADIEASNGATSTVSHYDFAYGTTTAKAAADSDSFAFATTQLTGAVLALASFKLALAAPVNTAAPIVTGGALTGDTASCTQGNWTGNPPPTYGYQWYRGATPISGATNTSYVTVSGDAGQSLTCQVTASNSQGSATQASNAITPGAGPNETNIDNFNRADGLLPASGGPWAGTAITNSAAVSGLRVISNQLGWDGANSGVNYTTTGLNGTTDCDVLIDCAVAPNIEMDLYLLLTGGGTSNISCYFLTLTPGSFSLNRIANGVNTGSLGSGSMTLAAGDTIWFSKRGSALKISQRASGGSFVTKLSVTDANHNPSNGVIGVELLDATSRWDNLRGGPPADTGVVYTDSRGGTTTTNGTAAETATAADTQAGTAVASGTGTDSYTAADTAAGTATANGTGSESVTRSDAASGTIAGSGTGTDAAVHAGAGTATAVVSGTGSDSYQTAGAYDDTATGTVTATGTRTETATHDAAATGTATISGTGSDQYAYTDAATGTVTIDGTGVDQRVYTDTTVGTVTAAGTGTDSYQPPIGYTDTAAGAIAAAGTGSDQRVYTDTAAGTTTAAGTGTDAATVTATAAGVVTLDGTGLELHETFDAATVTATATGTGSDEHLVYLGPASFPTVQVTAQLPPVVRITTAAVLAVQVDTAAAINVNVTGPTLSVHVTPALAADVDVELLRTALLA